MSYKLKPIYYFETDLSTGIEKVPVGRIVVVQNILGETKWYVKETNTGLIEGSTIQDAIIGGQIFAPLDAKSDKNDTYTKTEVDSMASLFAGIDTVYTKEDIDAMVALFRTIDDSYSIDDTYSKSEIDLIVSGIGGGSTPGYYIEDIAATSRVETKQNYIEFTGDLIPSLDESYSIGTPTKEIQELFLSSNSLYIGGVKVSTANDNIQIPLPAMSRSIPGTIGIGTRRFYEYDSNGTLVYYSGAFDSEYYTGIEIDETQSILVDIDQIGHRDIYRANPYTYYFKNEDGTSVVYDNRYYSKIVFVNPIILTNKNNCTLDCSNFTGPLHGNTTPPTVDFQYDANGDLLSMEIIDYGDSIEFDEIFLHDGTVPGTEYTISVFISVPRGEKVTMDEIATTSEVKAKQDAFVDYPSSSKGSLGDLPGMIAISSSHIYYCVAEYDGVTDIWARVALTTETW